MGNVPLKSVTLVVFFSPIDRPSLLGRANVKSLMLKKFLVTGGAGFIGSAVVRKLIRDTSHHVLVVDKLTYAGNLDSLVPISGDSRYRFERCDICDGEKVRNLLFDYQPDVLLHL